MSVLFTGVNLTVTDHVILREGELTEICVNISESEPVHERDIQLSLSVRQVDSSNISGK